MAKSKRSTVGKLKANPGIAQRDYISYLIGHDKYTLGKGWPSNILSGRIKQQVKNLKLKGDYVCCNFLIEGKIGEVKGVAFFTAPKGDIHVAMIVGHHGDLDVSAWREMEGFAGKVLAGIFNQHRQLLGVSYSSAKRKEIGGHLVELIK